MKREPWLTTLAAALLACSRVPSADLATFVGPAAGGTYVYDLTGDGEELDGTVEVGFRATCGSSCMETETMTRINNLPGVTGRNRLWVADGVLFSVSLRDGKMAEDKTILLREPLQSGSSWQRERRIYAREASGDQREGTLMPTQPSSEVVSCKVVDVEERPVLGNRRIVVSVSCETTAVGVGVGTTIHEEFAAGIGLMAVTEELKMEGGGTSSRSHMRLREVRQ